MIVFWVNLEKKSLVCIILRIVKIVKYCAFAFVGMSHEERAIIVYALLPAVGGVLHSIVSFFLERGVFIVASSVF